MPRPEINRSRSGAPKSKNPFAAWAAKRREAKQAAAEEAAQKITNDTAKNEAAFVETLASIDFLHSKLPKEALEAKVDPNRPCGDLEYCARAMQQMLIKNPQTLSVDLRPIDEKLMNLVILFKQAVEQGDEKAAFAAKAGLVQGFTKIRNRIPENQPELFKLFVETNVKYLDSWITLVNLAETADRMKQNFDREKALYDEELAKEAAATDALYELLKTDAEYNAAFNKMNRYDAPEDRRLWTPKQREVHVDMVERRMNKGRLNLKKTIVTQSEQDLTSKLNQVEVLYTKVAKIPIVEDPNLINKYREQIDQLFGEMAKSDAEIDESLKIMDEIEGRIEQLNNAPGAVRAREVAMEEAERAVEDINEMLKKRAGVLDAQKSKGLREIGILSEEELRAMQQELAEEEARETQEMMDRIENIESDVIYN